jgi:hypothetical protein
METSRNQILRCGNLAAAPSYCCSGRCFNCCSGHCSEGANQLLTYSCCLNPDFNQLSITLSCGSLAVEDLLLLIITPMFRNVTKRDFAECLKVTERNAPFKERVSSLWSSFRIVRD